MSAADDMTVTVQVDGDDASGFIFRPGDTLVVRLPDSGTNYSDNSLEDIALSLREAFGNTVEVVLLDPSLTIYKGVQLHGGESNE